MKLLITCPFWLGSLLAQELKRLKLIPFDTFSRGCWVETDLKGMYQINLWSRLANKVYIQLVSGEARTFDQLFELIKKSDYPQRTNNTNITLKVNIQSSQLSSQRTVQSVAHKALLESIARIGKQQENTDELMLFLEKNQCWLYLNSSWKALYQRGYRTQAGSAPLKENLAAAMVLLSGWKFKSPLVDYFSGAGTILMEALLIAKNIAPGSHRQFAFQHFENKNLPLRENLLQEAKNQIFSGQYQLTGYDIDPKMTQIAIQNAKNRNLEKEITFETWDFLQRKIDFSSSARILSNPPYGKRITSSELQKLYQKLNKSFSDQVFGWYITNLDIEPENTQQRSSKQLFNWDEKCKFRYKKLS